MNATHPRILIFAPLTAGGFAEHTFYQTKALAERGAEVTCLVAPSYLKGREVPFPTIRMLMDPAKPSPSRILKKLKMAWRLLVNEMILVFQIVWSRPSLVLLESYTEYLSPLWIWPHWFLARICGIQYAANLHDPVRNYQVGPAWWHKLSVRLAYWPLDFVLIHNKLPDPSPVPASIATVEVPVGIYEIAGSPARADDVRADWGVKPGQKVFLAFGYVRDGKNLDLIIQAMPRFPEAFLIVAGSLASGNEKPFSYYIELAEKQGVADRCRFDEGFVSDEMLGGYFAGTDFVLLTYSASFHSQSGVLNIAARARKPVLASAAPGPLMESVRNFSLGPAIPPDSLEAIIEGMRQLLTVPPHPRWEDYEDYASWGRNAAEILKAAHLPIASKSNAPTPR